MCQRSKNFSREYFVCLLSLAVFVGAVEDESRGYLAEEHTGKTVDGMLKLQETWTSSCDSEHCEVQKLCWGYEKNCNKENRLFLPMCQEPSRPWANSLEEKRELFWKQGDFGYVKDVTDSLVTLCEKKGPLEEQGSSLVCSNNLRFCRATNMLLDLSRFDEIAQRPNDRYARFREDIFLPGEVGGFCTLNKSLLRQHNHHKSPLQSWYAELEEYTELDFNPFNTGYCDEFVTMPTVFIKLDAGINLYHHFCDFFNLYASQHGNGSFSQQINIVMWDTSRLHYGDLFADTWKAFSHYPIKRLSDYAGKKVCFSDVMFPLLARMMYGLYYNTYIVPGCSGSALMQAFSKHLLSRLNITREDHQPEKVHITLLSRSTKHRRILNEDELVRAMKTVGYFNVRVVDYHFRTFPFLEQLKSTHNSDIFIGMHGAGLTHLLFLPDWAAVFEIYNTEDPRCYHDLARLRGVQYQTWEDVTKLERENEGKHPQLGTPHAKFTNYSFDVTEFMRIMTALGESVRERKKVALTHSILKTTSDEL